MATLIFMRGTRTAQIIEQAAAENVYVKTTDNIIIVCRDNDNLAQKGDISVSQFGTLPKNDSSYIVVANGGTTAQAATVITTMMETAFSKPKKGQHKVGALTIMEVQPEGASIIYERG